MKRTGFYVLLLITVNVLIVSLAAVWGLRGTLQEQKNLQTTRRLMENRLSVKERNLSAYDDNAHKLAELTESCDNGTQVVVPYARLAAVMSEANAAAVVSGLRETVFETREPIEYETSGSQTLYEVKAFAVYEGSYDALCNYMEALSGDYDCYQIERLAVQAAPVASVAPVASEGDINARMDFTIFGVRDNE